MLPIQAFPMLPPSFPAGPAGCVVFNEGACCYVRKTPFATHAAMTHGSVHRSGSALCHARLTQSLYGSRLAAHSKKPVKTK